MDILETKENKYYTEYNKELGEEMIKDDYIIYKDINSYTESPLHGFSDRLAEFGYIEFQEKNEELNETEKYIKNTYKIVLIVSILVVIALIILFIRSL